MSNSKTAERLIVPPESLERISMDVTSDSTDETEERTQPMKLSFLALLAARDPLVQTRLSDRTRLALVEEEEVELPADERPTDPMIPTKSTA